MKFNCKHFFAIGLFLFSIGFISFASASTSINDMSEGCKSCVKNHDCSRINKTCNATCKANLYAKDIDLDSCRASCIGKLEKCLLNANKSCKFYCADS
jgi:hypothetical protein